VDDIASLLFQFEFKLLLIAGNKDPDNVNIRLVYSGKFL
jgi:hypothetical protein